jgi:hypothetical protein
MADKIQPVSKPVPKGSGMASPSGYSTLTTPEPCYGRLFGSGSEAKDAKGMSSMMGKKSKKS